MIHFRHIQWFKLDRLKVFKIAMRVILEDESCDNLEYAGLLLERLREDYRLNQKQYQSEMGQILNPDGLSSSAETSTVSSDVRNTLLNGKKAPAKVTNSIQQSASTNSQAICDEVIRDSIGSCREPDYKMELAKLLSGEAKIELYIQHGKLSNAQRLACNMNRPDYVSSIIKEAAKLNQNHVKTVCQVWLANYETRNFMR